MSDDLINLLNLLIPVVIFVVAKYSLGRKGASSFKKRDFIYLIIALGLIFFGTGMSDRNTATLLVNAAWAIMLLNCLGIL